MEMITGSRNEIIYSLNQLLAESSLCVGIVLQKKRYSASMKKKWCPYVSKKKGLINIHILLSATENTKQGNMGKGQVHGCIFLSIEESRRMFRRTGH